MTRWERSEPKVRSSLKNVIRKKKMAAAATPVRSKPGSALSRANCSQLPPTLSKCGECLVQPDSGGANLSAGQFHLVKPAGQVAVAGDPLDEIFRTLDSFSSAAPFHSKMRGSLSARILASSANKPGIRVFHILEKVRDFRIRISRLAAPDRGQEEKGKKKGKGAHHGSHSKVNVNGSKRRRMRAAKGWRQLARPNDAHKIHLVSRAGANRIARVTDISPC